MNQKITASRLTLFISVFGLLLFLTSCSRIYWSYKYADVYLLYKADSLFDLNSKQEDELEKIVANFFTWHKQEELPEISTFFSDQTEKIQLVGRLEEQGINDLYALVEQKLRLYARRYYPDLAKILVTLNQQQIDHLRKQLEESNESIEEDLSNDEAEVSQEKLERRLENFKTYLGSLTADQENMIRDSYQYSHEVTKHRLASRIKGQREFITLLETIREPETLSDKLYEVTENPDQWRTQEYIAALAKRREQTESFITAFVPTLSSKQIQFLTDKLNTMNQDLRKLTLS